ncbi:BatD family protein [Bythopirellula polymerisocia]|uniref:Tetratricopeptide repeat protein n=1 Tax=Bythopirellula polymerisocia TaxID=2528003 RepID=A0A5C6CSY4_9BACT|nr:BatD family protein [Bythopirellula polymerisocia]TWU25859.1 Tetratricopeptide repeat protein [Bythopirellula polymerisocia]
MQHFISNICRFLVLATLIGGGALQASAADVRVGVSSRDTYVGMPVVLQIQVSNASSVEPPVIPTVDGLDIHSRGTPSQSTQITAINGRTTKNTSLTYVYEVVPVRAGSFRIPPITIEMDGTQKQTQAIEFVASKSETGDLMFVEVAGKEKEIYVGQALDLTLKIWLRPFRDSERNITLSAGDMWKMISPSSSWGVFGDRIEQMANTGQRPKAQEVLRKDRDGVEHSYYLYEIDATIYPKHAGAIAGDDIHVIVEYPTALGTARDPFASMFDSMPFPGGFGMDDFPSPFGRRLAVQSVRPIVSDASVESINVRPIPTADRPGDYRGAVGDYGIVTEARQTSVKAGDPIELLIGIVGTGPMELVQAPPLAELSELTTNFKVPNEPLAGFVQEDRKVFSTTIRPRKDGITEIPAIPFTFFDPQQDQFVTVRSKPISIHVDPTDTLALDAIVGSRSAASNRVEQGVAASGEPSASFQNYSGDGLLSSEAPQDLSPGTLFFLVTLPPLIVVGIGIALNRSSVSQLLGRLGFGSHQVQTRILEAKTAAEVCRTLQSYLARRLGLNSDLKDTSEIIGALRAAGNHKLAVQCERVFHTINQPYASGVSRTASLEDVKHEALEVLSEMQRHHLRKHTKPKPRQFSAEQFNRIKAGHGRGTSHVASLVVLAGTIALTSCLATAGTVREPLIQSTPNATSPQDAQSEPRDISSVLEAEQKQAILEQAGRLYDSAMNSHSQDSADAKQAFANAAEKYQLLVDSGVANSRLYVNMANTYLQSGQQGKAIANYKRALEIDPGNRKAQINLEHAMQLVAPSVSEGSDEVGNDFAALASATIAWLTRNLSPRFMGGIAVSAWFALWLVLGLRLIGLQFPWKTLAATAGALVIFSASLYSVYGAKSDHTIAIISSPSTELRKGDGLSFPVTNLKLSEGQAVEFLKQRGDWLKIRSESGQTGWVQSRNVEVI